MSRALRRALYRHATVLTAWLVCASVCNVTAQSTPGTATEMVLIDAPPPPIAPATIARDAQGRATVRAVRLGAPLKIDGKLDEEVYRVIPAAAGFIQQTPNPGQPATELTDFWILYDDSNLYISMLLHETHPERRVGSELRRDARGLTNDDNVMLVLDTFYDRRNAFNFQVNSVGGFRDQVITDAAANGAWNTIWDVKVSEADIGWSFEMMIPFKSLRYRGGGPQIWGFNARRTTRWKNEVSYVNPVPVQYGGRGINRLSTAATLVGVETPAQSMNLEIKPYAIASTATDLTGPAPYSNKGKGNIGLDLKYGLTRSLTADVTVNTDFAQVEEDVQQVNLTRFSLFFPEKRDFFLEGAGNFDFGLLGTGGSIQAGDVPALFFSRRIGLHNGQEVPVLAGGRVTGRVGTYEVGVLSIQTGEKLEIGAESTNFTVARVRRNILRNSNIGVIATLREPAVAGNRNVAYGADASFRFGDNVDAVVYIARTTTGGVDVGDDLSYRAQLAYDPDLWGFSVEHLRVGRGFDPQIGFLRRGDFRTSSASARYSPRFRNNEVIRQIAWSAKLDYTTDSAATRLENRDITASFRTEFENSDSFSVTYLDQYEYLPSDFRIAAGVVVPMGAYNYSSISGEYSLGNQRMVSGTVSVSQGSFYQGTRTTGGYAGRLSFSSRFVLEPGITLNRVKLPFGDFSANLLNTRIVVTPSPRMQISSLWQFNPSAKTLTSSVRLRWEYIPGSDLFVVYSDGRDTNTLTPVRLLNRTFAVKATRLFRF